MNFFRCLLSTQAGYTSSFLRILIGWIFFKAGSGKWFGWFDGPGYEKALDFFTNLNIPYPAINLKLAATTELVGGACLIVGLLSRLVSIPLAFTMVVAIFTAHRDGGYYYPLVIMFSCISFIGNGAGKLSVDHLISKNSSHPN